MDRKKLDLINSMAIVDDPIEIHILEYLDRIKNQNLRLIAYVKKSGIWAELKEMEKWNPYDFYHYFCNLYQDKYKKAYRLQGNIVRAYQRIEWFIKKNKIPKEEYKEFIDTAFARYFNHFNIPVVASICSSALYNYLMARNTKPAYLKDRKYDLDLLIEEENEKFEKCMNEDNYDYLDRLLQEEAENFNE